MMEGEVILKKQKFLNALKKAEFDKIFDNRDVEEYNASIFEARQNIQNGQQGDIFIIFEDSLYSTCTITFAKLDNLNKKEQILELINELNDGNKFIKYKLNKDNEIEAVFAFIGNAEQLDAELFLELTIHTFKIMQENAFKKVMRILWS